MIVGALARGAAIALVAAGVGACFSVREYPGPEGCITVGDCDDDDPCTLDYCDEQQVCHNDPSVATAPDDADPCTQDVCTDGHATHTIVANECGNNGTLQCDEVTGACTGCSEDWQCGTAATDPCREWVCSNGTCQSTTLNEGFGCTDEGVCDGEGVCMTCNDDRQNGGETDVDCGGRCAALQGVKCALGKRCDSDLDCQEGLTCTAGICCMGSTCSGG